MNATATAGSVEMIDPHVLILEQNIRTEAPIDKAFVETIRQEGVLQPVLGWRDSEGVHVRAGQRRTLGAREAGVATIPSTSSTSTRTTRAKQTALCAS